LSAPAHAAPPDRPLGRAARLDALQVEARLADAALPLRVAVRAHRDVAPPYGRGPREGRAGPLPLDGPSGISRERAAPADRRPARPLRPRGSTAPAGRARRPRRSSSSPAPASCRGTSPSPEERRGENPSSG